MPNPTNNPAISNIKTKNKLLNILPVLIQKFSGPFLHVLLCSWFLLLFCDLSYLHYCNKYAISTNLAVFTHTLCNSLKNNALILQIRHGLNMKLRQPRWKAIKKAAHLTGCGTDSKTVSAFNQTLLLCKRQHVRAHRFAQGFADGIFPSRYRTATLGIIGFTCCSYAATACWPCGW